MPYYSQIYRPPVVTINEGDKTTAGTVDQAVQTLSKAARIIAGTPAEGFPASAEPGQFFMFKSQPGSLYVKGSDEVWRAIPLVPVT